MSGNENANIRKMKLSDVFSEIPQDVWENIVKKEPEWLNMETFSHRFGFGPFAVLMIVTGLNDYQLKGKAEEAYWPKIQKILEISLPPRSPTELYNLLRPFYQKERFKERKIERLGRFLRSPLASELWINPPQRVSTDFLNIWSQIAMTMHQKPQAKTIAFAMKCLGISLLIAGEYKFDFTVPIPVDSRVKEFTKQLGFQVNKEEDIRKLWDEILSMLQCRNPAITMIHLDSFVWQLASMNKYNLQNYFRDLGNPRIGDGISSLLQSTTYIKVV
ncbi:MAG: N-glycosylase/DNA lyase [Candidatus Methanoperedens sp.]|nr:N-glycosylase/DNA lyase [Candidatus Methanoperedens sp.]